MQRHPEQTFSGLIWLKGLGILLRKALFCLKHSLSLLPGRLSFAKARPWYRLCQLTCTRSPDSNGKWSILDLLLLKCYLFLNRSALRLTLFWSRPQIGPPIRCRLKLPWTRQNILRASLKDAGWRQDRRPDSQYVSGKRNILSMQSCQLVYKRSKRATDPFGSLTERSRRC